MKSFVASFFAIAATAINIECQSKQAIGVSDYDQKLLNENWKIGAKSESFLPGSGQPEGAFDYDQKLLNENWKIGASSDSFLPPDQNSFVEDSAVHQLLIPIDSNSFVTSDFATALKVRDEIRRKFK